MAKQETAAEHADRVLVIYAQIPTPFGTSRRVDPWLTRLVREACRSAAIAEREACAGLFDGAMPVAASMIRRRGEP